LYNYDSNTNLIEKKQAIKTDNQLLDFTIDKSDNLYLLTVTKEKCYCVESFKFKDDSLKENGKLQIGSGILEYCESNRGGDMETLHKRWFDNMKDYMERKQMRLEQSKAKLKDVEEVPAKKLKVDEN